MSRYRRSTSHSVTRRQICHVPQTLVDVMAVPVMLSCQLHQMALLQSPGACVLQGPDKPAWEALQELLKNN
jgi:hypothetical protein